MKKYLLTTFLVVFSLSIMADELDELQAYLQDNQQIQEKIYIHTDNTCYYVGDTIWYKAYVLRADSLRPTHLSKILYVELLSPDGLVAERQRIVISDKGYTNGQFELKDSLYSGYYEIRAYTRWMLNFNVFEHEYTRDDRHKFYNNQMAKDFFRDWDGLYSRVIPIYSKPKELGNYDDKYMYSRPKQEIVKPKKDKLSVSFYPEGGELIDGIKSRVAFEVVDQNGQAVDIQGKLTDGKQIATTYMGRGVFDYTPNGNQKAEFEWKGKTYHFSLPESLPSGITFAYQWKNKVVNIASSPSISREQMAFAVMCRGKLCHFERLNAGTSSITLPSLPTGVNELMIIDGKRNIHASRLIFVNNHDMETKITVSTGGKIDYMPYDPIDMQVSGVDGLFSIAVRDSRTDEASYDNGNMLTDMLLSSDLKGFIANPIYYFSGEDDKRKTDLDMLMMVQGWRKYRPVDYVRYQPEKTLTIEGAVYKQLGVPLLYLDDVRGLNDYTSVFDEMDAQITATTGFETGNDNASESNGSTEPESYGIDESQDNTEEIVLESPYLGVNHGGLKHEVLVEAEVTSVLGESAGSVQLTHNGGRFMFEIPPYYGKALLLIKAYNVKDSVKKSMTHGIGKDFLNEEAYPDYYVKQDLFYPVFSHEYNYYQNHMPPVDFVSYVEEDTTAYMSKLDGDHTLSTVNVSARRRGRRAIDYNKPAYVINAYDLYNEATDRGLSWGVPNMGTFPPVACFTVYGNLRRHQDYNVRAKIDTYTFYTNYSPLQESIKNRSDAAIFNDLHLKRIQNFRFFTDYEPRNVDSLISQSMNRDDITLVYETVPNNGIIPTYRDRKYDFPGFNQAESFYHPNYEGVVPDEPKDYRRTLYWNPNARPDENGQFHVKFYNNSRETRIRVSAAGISQGGKIYTY